MQMPQAVGETNLVACWLAKKKKKGSQITCCRSSNVVIISDENTTRNPAIGVWKKEHEFWNHEDLN